MKKITPVFLIICTSLFSLQLKAQAPTGGGAAGGNEAFQHGSFDINPSLGYGYDYGYVGTFFPALIISGDYGLKVNAGPGTIAIGGELGFKYGSYDYSFGNYSASYSETYIAVRGTYHWTPPGASKVDLYGGIPLGIRFDHYSEYLYGFTGYDAVGNRIYGYYNYSATGSDLLIGLYIGASYYFSNKVGIFGELGYNISILTIGVNIKLK